MEKKNKIIYWVSTGLLTLMMCMSVIMYLTKTDMVAEVFVSLGYPAYIVYPLALVKVLGLIAIWTRKSKTLLEWAYAGFFFDFLLAASAHVNISDGEQIPSIVAIFFLAFSYAYQRKVFVQAK